MSFLPSVCTKCLDGPPCVYSVPSSSCLCSSILQESRLLLGDAQFAQFIFLCLWLVLIESQRFPCGTAGSRERRFVPEICSLALLKKVAVGFVPHGDRVQRVDFRSSSPVLLRYVLGILRCYGNFQIFSFCKVRYLT